MLCLAESQIYHKHSGHWSLKAEGPYFVFLHERGFFVVEGKIDLFVQNVIQFRHTKEKYTNLCHHIFQHSTIVCYILSYSLGLTNIKGQLSIDVPL